MLKKKMHALLLQEFARFPESEVQDYYKLLFQTTFGAEHMIQDEQTCLKMIEDEMSQIEANSQCPLYYEISLYIPLIRVNLARCLVEKISGSDIASAFFEGSKSFRGLYREKFEDLVKIMITQLRDSPFNLSENLLQNFQNKIKRRNFPAVHHSDHYRKIYKPHYRIIPLDIWKKWMLKKKTKFD